MPPKRDRGVIKMAGQDIVDVFTAEDLEQFRDRVPETEHDRAAEDLINALGSLGEGYYVTVHRCPMGSTGSEEYCERFAADKYTPADLMDHLRIQWGPGDYRIRVWEQGKRGVRQNKLVTITRPATPVVTNQGNDLAAVASLFAQLQQQSEARFERLLTTLKPAEENSLDKTIDLMVKLRTAMGQPATAVPQADPFETMSKAMAGMLGLMGNMKQFATLAGVGEAAGAVSDSESIGPALLGMAKEFLPVVAQYTRNEQSIRMAKEARQAGETVANRRPAAKPLPKAEPLKVPEGMTTVLETLLSAADQGQDEEDAASQLLETAAAMPPLKSGLDWLLSQNDPLSVVFTVKPETVRRATWFGNLLAILDELTSEESQGENVTTQSPGNLDNVGSTGVPNHNT